MIYYSNDPDLIFVKMMPAIGKIPTKSVVKSQAHDENREYLETLHRRASTICPMCKKPIGYESGYYQKKDDDKNLLFLVHDKCETNWFGRKSDKSNCNWNEYADGE